MQFFYRNLHQNTWRKYGHIQSSTRTVVFGLLLFPICAFSQITVSPASSSGVTNTGNAAVGDVANGKTFSSSVLTNATGTSTKNATVPNDAPIQPPQAYVGAFQEQMDALGFVNVIYMEDLGITSIDLAAVVGGNTLVTVELGGNALPQSNIDSILAYVAGHQTGFGGTLELQGGTNSPPTKDIVNSITISNGGTGYSNGEDLIFTGGGGAGAAATITTTTGAITGITFSDHGSGYTSNPIVTVDSSGSGSVLTAVRKNGNQVELEDNGWTVTTN